MKKGVIRIIGLSLSVAVAFGSLNICAKAAENDLVVLSEDNTESGVEDIKTEDIVIEDSEDDEASGGFSLDDGLAEIIIDEEDDASKGDSASSEDSSAASSSSITTSETRKLVDDFDDGDFDTFADKAGITIDEGEWGDLTWKLEDTGRLIISGNGDMEDFVISPIEAWRVQKDKITYVVINKGVRNVSDNAFRECRNLTAVSFSKTVTVIGDYAFYYCTELPKVTLPNNLIKIDSNAFSHCEKLSKIVIPYSTTSFGSSVFAYCPSITSAGPIGGDYDVQFGWKEIIPGIFNYFTNLQEVMIPEGIKTIESSAFSGCSKLEEIIFPKSLAYIGQYAFRNCTGLKKLTITDNITEMGSYAFDGCKNLSKITFGKGLTSISSCAFQNCHGLVEVVLPEEIGSIGYNAFYNCKNLTTVTFGKRTVLVNSEAFAYCKKLKNIDFSKIRDIGSGAFAFCYSLKNVAISDEVSTIERRAFENCINLESVTIPAGIKSIKEYAFNNCTALVKVNYNSTPNAWKSVEKGIYNNPLTTAKIYYSKYRANGKLGNITWTLDENGKLILKGKGVVQSSDNLSYYSYKYPWLMFRGEINEVVISDGITGIGSYAFDNMTIETMVIPASLKYIDSASSSCGCLDSVRDAYYAGSRDGWQNLLKKAPILKNATVHYNNVIVFDANGGKVNIKSKPFTKGKKYGTLPTPAARTGYTFKGWYLSVDGTDKVTANTKITKKSTHTLYAHWKANTYTVKFNANGGKGTTKSMSCSYGKYYTLKANAFKAPSGYKFKGWNTKKDGSGTAYSNKAIIRNLSSKNGGTATLYAQWEKSKFTVTFNPNGGTVSKKKVKVGAKYANLITPTREGYEFKGWYTAKTGGLRVTNGNPIAYKKNHTLYAHWKKIN